MNPVLLEAIGVGKRFGGLQALDKVDLSIAQGEIFGLIGPNGAGKTTLFNVLTGLYPLDEGDIRLGGTSLRDTPSFRLLQRSPRVLQPLIRPFAVLKPSSVAKAGIARTFQNIRLFPNMSALENVMIGRHVRTHAGVLGAMVRDRRTRHEEAAIREAAHEWLHFTGIAQHVGHTAKHLSYGDQRRLEIARALATEPRLLALDEPAAGMNPTEKQELRGLLERIQSLGITILLIEHDVKLMLGLCHRMAVLDYGKKIAEGSPEQIKNDPRVIEAYLGAPA